MKIAAFLFLGILSLQAFGQDLGVYGQTYPIQEPDQIEAMKNKIRQKMESGEFDRLKKEAQDQVKASTLEPPPVAGLAAATEPRVFWFDPTVRVEKAILGPNGMVVVPAGTTINPLDYSPFVGKWIFIDGREEQQRKWAKAQLIDTTVRPIFVAGRWMDSWREWGRRTYFDQGGAIVHRLGIHATPAIVTQDPDGRRIRIEEVVLR